MPRPLSDALAPSRRFRSLVQRPSQPPLLSLASMSTPPKGGAAIRFSLGRALPPAARGMIVSISQIAADVPAADALRTPADVFETIGSKWSRDSLFVSSAPLTVGSLGVLRWTPSTHSPKRIERA